MRRWRGSAPPKSSVGSTSNGKEPCCDPIHSGPRGGLMPWVRIDEEFARHPKVVAAGPLGMAMQVAALCYCNQYLTDGFIPRTVVAGLLDFAGLGMRMWQGD